MTCRGLVARRLVKYRRGLGWLSRGANEKRPQVWTNDRPDLCNKLDHAATFFLTAQLRWLRYGTKAMYLAGTATFRNRICEMT